MWPRILLGAPAVVSWGVSFRLFSNRRRLDHINAVLPLLRRQRRASLHPLFRDTSEATALSGSFFYQAMGLTVILAQ